MLLLFTIQILLISITIPSLYFINKTKNPKKIDFYSNINIFPNFISLIIVIIEIVYIMNRLIDQTMQPEEVAKNMLMILPILITSGVIMSYLANKNVLNLKNLEQEDEEIKEIKYSDYLIIERNLNQMINNDYPYYLLKNEQKQYNEIRKLYIQYASTYKEVIDIVRNSKIDIDRNLKKFIYVDSLNNFYSIDKAAKTINTSDNFIMTLKDLVINMEEILEIIYILKNTKDELNNFDEIKLFTFK